MSQEWIKVTKATARKPEILRISSALNIHPDHAFGLCIRFWCWCDDQVSDGHALGVTLVTLDMVLGHAGFATQLVKAGWLTETDDGVDIPHFDYHLSKSAKTRAQSAIRKERSRSKRDNGHEVSVTKTGPEESRVEKNITTEGPTRKLEHTIPKKLDDMECRSAAQKWFLYLESKGLEDKSPDGNEIALEEWWRQMARMSRTDFLEAVSESIAGGRWNVSKNRGPQSNGTLNESDDEFLDTLNVCKRFSTDKVKLKEMLKPEILRAVLDVGMQAILEAQEAKNFHVVSKRFKHALKTIRSRGNGCSPDTKLNGQSSVQDSLAPTQSIK